MEEEYDDQADPYQFEEFSGDLDPAYVQEFAVMLGMHPIRDQRLLWWAEQSWLLVRNYKQEFCWVNEELMQVEKLPPNLNNLTTQFVELRKEYVRLINMGMSAEQASLEHNLFRVPPRGGNIKAPVENTASKRQAQPVRQFDTAERSAHKETWAVDLDSEQEIGDQYVQTGNRAKGGQINGSVGRTGQRNRIQDRVGDIGIMEGNLSSGRQSGNTGSARFTEPRKTEEESNKKLDPRQALFASASASANGSNHKRSRQQTPRVQNVRANNAMAIHEDYDDDADELFEYENDLKGYPKNQPHQEQDPEFEMGADLADPDEEGMYIDGYEEHDQDEYNEVDEERAVAYRISQDEIDDYIASEKQSKANIAEQDFREHGSRNLRSSRGPPEQSLKNSSNMSNGIHDPIYLQLRGELDAIKKKINNLEGEHIELRNINSQLMSKSGVLDAIQPGSSWVAGNSSVNKEPYQFGTAESRVSDDPSSTQQMIEQELKEIKELIQSSLRNQTAASQSQSQQINPQSRLDSPSVAIPASTFQATNHQPSQLLPPLPPVPAAPGQQFYFNSAFSLGSPTAYLSPGDPLQDQSQASPIMPPISTGNPRELLSSVEYPANPYLGQSGQVGVSNSGGTGLGAGDKGSQGMFGNSSGQGLYNSFGQSSQHFPSGHLPPRLPSENGEFNPLSRLSRKPKQPLSKISSKAHKPSSSQLSPAVLATPSSTSSSVSGASLPGQPLSPSSLGLFHKWTDLLRLEWQVTQREGAQLHAKNKGLRGRKAAVKEMEWEVLQVLGQRSGSLDEASGLLGDRVAASVVEGLRHAVFLYEFEAEKLSMLHELLRARGKKLKDIEKSLKISLKAGRLDTMADDYLTLAFHQYIELANLYESKLRIDTSRLVPYKRYDRSAMAPIPQNSEPQYAKFYQTEFIDRFDTNTSAFGRKTGAVFDESISHFDFLKESLDKLREGSLLPGEAVQVYSEIGMFFENQQLWFTQIKKQIKSVISRLNNPANMSALREV